MPYAFIQTSTQIDTGNPVAGMTLPIDLQDNMCDVCGQPLCDNCEDCHNRNCSNYVQPIVDCNVDIG